MRILVALGIGSLLWLGFVFRDHELAWIFIQPGMALCLMIGIGLMSPVLCVSHKDPKPLFSRERETILGFFAVVLYIVSQFDFFLWNVGGSKFFVGLNLTVVGLVGFGILAGYFECTFRFPKKN